MTMESQNQIPKLTNLRLIDGGWVGRLTTAAGQPAPELRVTLSGHALKEVRIEQDDEPGQWRLAVPLPIEHLADGVIVLQIADAAGDALIGEYHLVAGQSLPDDLRGEVSLLRAELDLLKRAFRRRGQERGRDGQS